MSLLGSSGWPGSVYSSRLPLPLVSTMSEVHPCDFAASPVSKNILVLSQPTGLSPAPPDVHSVSLASSAKFRCWVPKQVSIKVYLPVFGSSMASPRLRRQVRLRALLEKCLCFRHDGPTGGY